MAFVCPVVTSCPMRTVVSTATAAEKNSSAGTVEGDATDEVPFFLRDDLPEEAAAAEAFNAPPSPALFDDWQDSLEGARTIAQDLGSMAAEITGSVAEEVQKIDWDEVKSNVETFVQSEKAQKFKDSTVRAGNVMLMEQQQKNKHTHVLVSRPGESF